MQHNLRLRSVLPTFVPAGFVDVGHSTVRDARSGKTLVIVDSVQSIANHLEATIVTQPGQVIAGLEAMPFLRLTITDPHGRTRVTSSLERSLTPYSLRRLLSSCAGGCKQGRVGAGCSPGLQPRHAFPVAVRAAYGRPAGRPASSAALPAGCARRR